MFMTFNIAGYTVMFRNAGVQSVVAWVRAASKRKTLDNTVLDQFGDSFYDIRFGLHNIFNKVTDKTERNICYII